MNVQDEFQALLEQRYNVFADILKMINDGVPQKEAKRRAIRRLKRQSKGKGDNEQ